MKTIKGVLLVVSIMCIFATSHFSAQAAEEDAAEFGFYFSEPAEWSSQRTNIYDEMTTFGMRPYNDFSGLSNEIDIDVFVERNGKKFNLQDTSDFLKKSVLNHKTPEPLDKNESEIWYWVRIIALQSVLVSPFTLVPDTLDIQVEDIKVSDLPAKRFEIKGDMSYTDTEGKITKGRFWHTIILVARDNILYVFHFNVSNRLKYQEAWDYFLQSIYFSPLDKNPAEDDEYSSKDLDVSFRYPSTWQTPVILRSDLIRQSTWLLSIGPECEWCSGEYNQTFLLEKLSISPLLIEKYIDENNYCTENDTIKKGKRIIDIKHPKLADQRKLFVTGDSVYLATYNATEAPGFDKVLSTLHFNDSAYRAKSIKLTTPICGVMEKRKEAMKKAQQSFDGNLLEGKHTVTLDTNLGDIVLELDADKAPKAVTNFIELIKANYFENHVFDRARKGSYISGGGNLSRATLKDESSIFGEKLREEGCANNQKSKNGSTCPASTLSSFPKGTIALHNFGSPESSVTAFLITSRNTKRGSQKTSDSTNYIPFGKVIKGLNVINRIEKMPVDSDGNLKNPVTFTATILPKNSKK